MGQVIISNEGSTPSVPASGKWTLFFKSDGLFIEDAAGNVYGPLQAVSKSINLFLENTGSDIGGYKTLQTTVPAGGLVNDSASITGSDIVINEYATVAGLFTFLGAQVALVHSHLAKTAGSAAAFAYVKLYHRTSGGTETLLGTSANSALLAGTETEYSFDISIPDTVFTPTDRFVAKFYASKSGAGTNPTVNCYFQGTSNARVGLSGSGAGGTANPFDDGTAIIKGSSDATKLLRFEVDGFTTATTRVLTPQNRDGMLQLSDGWIDGLALGAWSYVSNSAPYGTFNINADVTGIIGIGDRIKFTQTTTKYFVVTAVGAYSGGNTPITIYGFSAIANAAITAPFYSHEKFPFGLPQGLDTKRVTTITSSATPTINTDNCDCVTITALAAAITSMTTNLSGTPTNFQPLLFRIKDDGTARAITWGASFEAGSVALPTTTIPGKTLMVGFMYDSVDAKWACEAAGSRA